MACKQVRALLVVVVTVGLGWIASATEFVVGGDDGWKLGVDYTAWAEDKAFKVGDSLGNIHSLDLPSSPLNTRSAKLII